jgi:hypothetical protein
MSSAKSMTRRQCSDARYCLGFLIAGAMSRHCSLSWGLGKGSIDENPSHRGFGFVRVQFAGAGWMYLPMRQWADATSLQQCPRYRAALHGDMRPDRAFNRPNQSANDPATGHNILPTGPDLRPVRELPMATGL